MQNQKFQLTKFENKTFAGVTLQISGNAYLNCKFEGCTLVFTNMPTALDGCHFHNCNWRIEYDILWGAPHTLKNLKGLIDKIDSGNAAAAKTQTGDASSDVH